ncbi:hypothetical protein MASR2M17_19320 [Aminivibrio sp.]
MVRRKIYMKLDNYMSVDSIVNPNNALASVILRHARYPSDGALSIIEKIDAEMLELVIPRRAPSREDDHEPRPSQGDSCGPHRPERGSSFVPVGATVIHGDDKVMVFASSDMMNDAVDRLGVK